MLALVVENVERFIADKSSLEINDLARIIAPTASPVRRWRVLDVSAGKVR